MKAIHNLLRQRLYRTQKPLIEHPPIDLLGAFSERALSGPDRAPVLQHLAQCADCREIVFLATPQGAQEYAALPSNRWISWPVLRWASVAACSVIVVAAMRLHPGYRALHPGVNPPVRQSQSTFESKQSVPTTPEIVNSAPQANSEGKIAESDGAVRRLHVAIPGKAKEAQLLSVESEASLDRQMFLELSPDYAHKDLSDLYPRWTLTAEGTLQQSLDGGITWRRIQVSHGLTFRAVAAAGQSIWLGGRRGVLFHSADAGEHWTQMQPTTKRNMPTSDIIGIEFEDYQHGKLTTASNESWTTSDAGQSWEKQ
jgi:Photosynthesis system II assembly factor YCF48/Putative zinc-finger